MNGVRRFLGGGGITLAQSPLPAEPPSSAAPFPTSTDGATPIPNENPYTTSSSRPTSDDSNRNGGGGGGMGRFSSPLMSPESPGTTTKGAFFRRKDSLPRVPAIWDDDRRSSSMSSPRSRSSSLPGRNSQPASPVRNGHVSRPPLPSLAKAIKASDASSRASPAISIPLSSSSLTWKNANPILNMKDELLVSLLASQAVVDSKDSEILSAEEVEELKREHALVASRVTSATRKLSTETRIRDAAAKLHTHGQATSSSNDQLTTANRKVEAAQQELYRLSDRANDLSKRLLEHRAGVLSFSIRSLEKKAAAAVAGTSMDTDESDTSTGLSGEMSPASTTATSLSVAPTRKFDGAHFFSGHADAITPTLVTPTRVRELETRLKVASESAEVLRKRLTESQRDMEILGLEKTELETRMSLELQTAEERVESLQAELEQTSEMAMRIADLEHEQREWETQRRELEDRLRLAESSQGRSAETEDAMIQLRAELLNKDSENKRFLEERKALTDDHDELLSAKEALRSMCRSNRIVIPLNESSISTMVAALETHIASFDEQKEQMMESRERLNSELENARRERESARQEAFKLKERSNSLGEVSLRSVSPALPIAMRRGSGDEIMDTDRIAAVLKPIWAILPSVEARATKLGGTGARAVTPRSPKNNGMNGKTPDSGVTPLSLSELDVRSLKALYDPKGNFTSPAMSGDFTLDDFADRVRALVADDRALVERLIRFAQAHDLLKLNAERAQKLAQESSMGLETYQKQVKTLEERNQTLMSKQTALLDEIDDLQLALDRLEEQKRALEDQAAEQAEQCKNLNEANDTLSAKTLALAAEAASAPPPEQLKKLEQQIAVVTKQLADVNEELDRTRAAESTQRVFLMDELNSLQMENENLRNQVRRQGSK